MYQQSYQQSENWKYNKLNFLSGYQFTLDMLAISASKCSIGRLKLRIRSILEGDIEIIRSKPLT